MTAAESHQADAKRPRVEAGHAVTSPESSSSKRVADERGVIPTPAAKRTRVEAARMNHNRLTTTLPTGDKKDEIDDIAAECSTLKETVTLQWQPDDMRALLQQSHPVERHNEHAKKRSKGNSSYAQSLTAVETIWGEVANHPTNADKKGSGPRYIREAAEHIATRGDSKKKMENVCPCSKNRVPSAKLHLREAGGDLEAWLESLQERAEKPTDQQLEVLQTIVDRITKEAMVEHSGKKKELFLVGTTIRYGTRTARLRQKATNILDTRSLRGGAGLATRRAVRVPCIPKHHGGTDRRRNYTSLERHPRKRDRRQRWSERPKQTSGKMPVSEMDTYR